jgi:16S rRNA G966 N2-methylase RsmD
LDGRRKAWRRCRDGPAERIPALPGDETEDQRVEVTDLGEEEGGGEAVSAILTGDMRYHGAAIKSGVINVIMTDPPYTAEFIPLYRDLAELAARVLKPRGLLITYAGQIHLDRIFDELKVPGLEYFWIVSQRNHGAKSLIYARGMMAHWKPILVYQKPDADGKIGPVGRIMNDEVTGACEKRYHPWQQPVRESIALLRYANPECGPVLDPFCGSGTCCLAAHVLGMDFLGIEIDPKTADIARERITQEPLVRWTG